MPRPHARSAALFLVAAAAVLPVRASADGRTAATASAAPSSAPRIPLAELPTLAPIGKPQAKPALVASLEGRLDQLLAMRLAHPLEPTADFAFLTIDLEPDIAAAIALELSVLRERLDGPRASRLLERARKEGSAALERRDKKKRSKSSDKKVAGRPGRADPAADAGPGPARDAASSDGDWLQFVLALGTTDDENWRGLARLYGMLRMLEASGTTAAARTMIDAYAYFGELVRIDLQRGLERMKDRALPALIEAKEHEARKVRDWARRRLDAMSKAIPGEAVSTADHEALADILRAFARVKDLDAARVVLSYTNSERAQLRIAARESIVAFGEPALWHVREAYESLTGEKPAKSWDARRALQELFRLHDESRLTSVYAAFSEGEAAVNRRDLPAAIAAFDQVLARAPLFERRAEMATTYGLHAATLEMAGKDDDAIMALRKARRLDPQAADRPRLESRIHYLEGKALAARGTPDLGTLRTAIELDPQNAEARALLTSLETKVATGETRMKRYAAAILAALVAFVGTLLLARRPRPKQAPVADTATGATAVQPSPSEPSPSEPSPSEPSPSEPSPSEPSPSEPSPSEPSPNELSPSEAPRD